MQQQAQRRQETIQMSTDMASSSVTDQVWEKTSTPTVIHCKRSGKYRLRLNYTPSKGSKSSRRTSQEQFSTADEARVRAVSWRLNWEQGRHGTVPNQGSSQETSDLDALEPSSPVVSLQGKSLNSLTRLNDVQEKAFKKQRREGGTRKRAEWAQSSLNQVASQETSDLDALGPPSPVVPLQGKSLNSMTRLNAVQEKAFKKQRREGGTRKRAEWVQLQLQSPREKRSLRRDQRKQDNTKKVRKQDKKKIETNLSARKAHAKQRAFVLAERTQRHKSLIDHLRMNIMQDDFSLLVADESDHDEAKSYPADGDDASSDAPSPELTLPATLSEAQRLRLTQQAMVTMEMLQRVYDREFLLQKKMEEAIRICDTVKSVEEPGRKNRQEFLKSLEEVALEVSLVRHGNTLDTVAKNVVEDFGIDKQASTIASWYREFLSLNGRFRPDCRGAHKRGRTPKVQEAHLSIADTEPGVLNKP